MIHPSANFFHVLACSLAIILSLQSFGLSGSAVASVPSQRLLSATALFEGSGIQATIRFFQNPIGPGANVSVFVSGLTEGFANAYHIHLFKVDSSGNCNSTGPHFNPTNAVPGHCDPQQPTQCETGDLAGKHGKILTPSDEGEFSTTYEDYSLQLTQSRFGILNRSVVIHGVGATRLACGTIVLDSFSPEDF